MERLLMVQDALGASACAAPVLPVYLVGLGAEARIANLKLAGILRRAGVPVELELEERSFKAQLRNVNKSGALLAVIRGESEQEKGVAAVKTMATGEQVEMQEAELADYLIGFARGL